MNKELSLKDGKKQAEKLLKDWDIAVPSYDVLRKWRSRGMLTEIVGKRGKEKLHWPYLGIEIATLAYLKQMVNLEDISKGISAFQKTLHEGISFQFNLPENPQRATFLNELTTEAYDKFNYFKEKLNEESSSEYPVAPRVVTEPTEERDLIQERKEFEKVLERLEIQEKIARKEKEIEELVKKLKELSDIAGDD